MKILILSSVVLLATLSRVMSYPRYDVPNTKSVSRDFRTRNVTFTQNPDGNCFLRVVTNINGKQNVDDRRVNCAEGERQMRNEQMEIPYTGYDTSESSSALRHSYSRYLKFRRNPDGTCFMREVTNVNGRENIDERIIDCVEGERLMQVEQMAVPSSGYETSETSSIVKESRHRQLIFRRNTDGTCSVREVTNVNGKERVDNRRVNCAEWERMLQVERMTIPSSGYETSKSSSASRESHNRHLTLRRNPDGTCFMHEETNINGRVNVDDRRVNCAEWDRLLQVREMSIPSSGYDRTETHSAIRETSRRQVIFRRNSDGTCIMREVTNVNGRENVDERRVNCAEWERLMQVEQLTIPSHLYDTSSSSSSIRETHRKQVTFRRNPDDTCSVREVTNVNGRENVDDHLVDCDEWERLMQVEQVVVPSSGYDTSKSTSVVREFQSRHVTFRRNSDGSCFIREVTNVNGKENVVDRRVNCLDWERLAQVDQIKIPSSNYGTSESHSTIRESRNRQWAFRRNPDGTCFRREVTTVNGRENVDDRRVNCAEWERLMQVEQPVIPSSEYATSESSSAIRESRTRQWALHRNPDGTCTMREVTNINGRENVDERRVNCEDWEGQTQVEQLTIPPTGYDTSESSSAIRESRTRQWALHRNPDGTCVMREVTNINGRENVEERIVACADWERQTQVEQLVIPYSGYDSSQSHSAVRESRRKHVTFRRNPDGTCFVREVTNINGRENVDERSVDCTEGERLMQANQMTIPSSRYDTSGYHSETKESHNRQWAFRRNPDGTCFMREVTNINGQENINERRVNCAEGERLMQVEQVAIPSSAYDTSATSSAFRESRSSRWAFRRNPDGTCSVREVTTINGRESVDDRRVNCAEWERKMQIGQMTIPHTGYDTSSSSSAVRESRNRQWAFRRNADGTCYMRVVTYINGRENVDERNVDCTEGERMVQAERARMTQNSCSICS